MLNSTAQPTGLTSGIRPEREAAHRFYEALGYERTSYHFHRTLGGGES